MDAEILEKFEALEARVAMLESVLADMEDLGDDGIDPIVAQHREFASRIRARREAE
jgi:hypothetical protein